MCGRGGGTGYGKRDGENSEKREFFWFLSCLLRADWVHGSLVVSIDGGEGGA